VIPGIPPPTTFSEGQRFIYGILASLAGMFCGAMAITMICLLMWGHWPTSEYHTIIVIFGWSLGGFIAAMVAVIIGLLTGGPVGRFKAGISKEGATFETDSTATAATVGAVAGAAAGATAGATAAAAAQPGAQQ
jgi:hypothetical protein